MKHCARIQHRPVLGCALLLCLSGWSGLVAWSHAASFEGLGFLSGYTNLSQAFGISADGSVVVGCSRFTFGAYGMYDRAFRWTRAGGMENLGVGTLGLTSQAWGASADGSVVVGLIDAHAVRWTSAEGAVGLGWLPDGYNSSAHKASADGSVIIGDADAGPESHAFRWTAADGMIDLGLLPGYPYSANGWDVSADGSTVVGYCTSDWPYNHQAFRWTTTGGMAGLGFLPGGSNSCAWAVSADGEVVAGVSQSYSGWQGFRWQGGMMTALGTLSGYTGYLEAVGMSADGSVIVGHCHSTPTPPRLSGIAATACATCKPS